MVLMARFNRGSRLRPIVGIKNISEISAVIAATTNTVALDFAEAVDSATLANATHVTRGCNINSIYLSVHVISEGGEIASEVPLVDWYVIKDNGGNFGTTFSTSALPTPGAQGTNENKRFIFHTEKGLSGGGDASLSGVPMIFKGVIRIPKGYSKMRSGDKIKLCIRTNFAAKFCCQAIYKWFT